MPPVVTLGNAVEETGHAFRSVGIWREPLPCSHVDLTRNLFGDCHGTVRGDFLTSMSTMDLLEREWRLIEAPKITGHGRAQYVDALTPPKKAEQIV